MAKTAKKPETVFISEADQYLFAQGTHYDIYKKLGAHLSEENGKKGVSFAVWAPHAQNVYVTGSFNGWDESKDEMKKKGPGGIYELFIPGVGCGEMYKFLITTQDGRKLYKADPFANHAELRPGTASITTDLSRIRWSDSVVEILEEGEDVCWCRHVSTGREMWILRHYLYSRQSDGLTHTEDTTDYELPIQAGDRLALVTECSRGYLVKKHGVTGWYRGRIQGNEE